MKKWIKPLSILGRFCYAAKGYAVGAENADKVVVNVMNWAGKGADRASENGDKKYSICSKKDM